MDLCPEKQPDETANQPIEILHQTDLLKNGEFQETFMYTTS